MKFMSNQWKAVIGIILIYLFGCFSGWISSSLVHYRQSIRLMQRGPVAMVDLLERRMTFNLNLDENQKKQIHDYFMENLEQRKQALKQIQPEYQAANRQTFQEIVAVLRPDQAQKFRENIDQFRQRFGKGAFNMTPENPPVTNSVIGAPPSGQ
jgi:hypothetical protein